MVSVVGDVFEPVNFDETLIDARGARERRDDLVELHGHALNHVGKGACVRRAFLNVEHDHRARGVVDEINHVIERGGEHVDVFAVERGDERFVEAGGDGVRQFVAGVLDSLDALSVGVVIAAVARVGHHLDEDFRGIENVGGHLREEREILILAGQKAETRHLFSGSIVGLKEEAAL
jgi:hypothetical protein